MSKTLVRHLVIVGIASVLSYGLYLMITNPETNLSADILGIQQSDTISSDLLISQEGDRITAQTNRILEDIESLYVLVMYDPERIDHERLTLQTSYDQASVFQDNQGSIVLTFDVASLEVGSQLFVLEGIDADEDVIIADIQATFGDGSTERLMFAQP